MAQTNPTNFYPQVETRAFMPILHRHLKKRNVTWNQFLNAIMAPLAAELSKPENLIDPKSPIVTLDLGVIDLSK